MFTAADLAAMEHITVSYQDAGKTTAYEGVPVETLLKKAGAPLNMPHGGQTLRMAVSARANDGYQVVYSLAEFDSAIMATRPVVADQSGGKPLGDKVGPFRLVMPGEKRARDRSECWRSSTCWISAHNQSSSGVRYISSAEGP